MNSSTSPFRPWLLALAALAAIELAYYVVARPPRITWNSFLDLPLVQTETFQRLVAYEKIVGFEDADPDIIQVGDSSGLHGVQPPIVMSHIPGYNYLNMSVATNLGYSGYYNMAKVQLERSPHARYLVLYTSAIGGVPRKILWDDDQKLMAPRIYSEFLSPLHRIVQVPTLAAREKAINYVVYLGYRFKARNAQRSTNRGYVAFHSIFRESNGWTRETDVEGDVPANIYQAILPGIDVNQAPDPIQIRAFLSQLPKVTDEQFFDWRTLSRESYFDYVYGAFAALAREHGAKLVIIFNPFPESAKRPEFEELMDWKALEAALQRVRMQHPDIYVGGFDFWPDEKFSVFSHIGTPHSDESSQRVGRIMKEIIGDNPPAQRKRTDVPARKGGPVEIDFNQGYCGYGWTDQAGNTNAFPLKYVGPRNRAWIYTAIAPGGAYTVRGEFQGNDPTLVGRIALKANGKPMRKLDSGPSGSEHYAEWEIPAEAVDRYRGWVTFELDLGGARATEADGKRSVAFQRLEAIPQMKH